MPNNSVEHEYCILSVTQTRISLPQSPMRKTVCLGWGLYSTRNMDVSQLATHFKRHRMDVACRWRYITHSKGKRFPDSKRPKALHFEVDMLHHACAQELLYQIYWTSDTTSTHFPCGYKMCFCPELAMATSSQQPSVNSFLN